mgnify:CR=1 FL=1
MFLFKNILSVFFLLFLLQTESLAKNGCETDDSGQVFCAPPGGTAVKNLRGRVVCAPGNCVSDNLGYIKCSPEKDGGVAIDNLGRAFCVGGCVSPSQEYCQQLTKEIKK